MPESATNMPTKKPTLPGFKPRNEESEQTRQQTKQLPPYNVVLLNDDDHTYEYVIEMLHNIFAHPYETAFEMAKTVDIVGRVIVLTTHRELAELKRDQILAYGRDPRIEASAGSMSATIEPAI